MDGECAECRRKQLLGSQCNLLDQADQSEVPPIVHKVLRSPGRPLDASTRASTEATFGHDFSRVQIHTDPKAAESARAVNAMAYTVGRHIVFGAGQYAPSTREGLRLLAHELAHVVQQGNKPTMLQRQPAPNVAPATAPDRRQFIRGTIDFFNLELAPIGE